ncbi:MAG TPA: ATP-dependent metallopeptidase FtsH/Yme1/Tma family protein, partial [Dehalococcoidia bacterium]|nr:ATP-dependent metallopeptidase FtsH/Yme1/Tma family protein [Dehalococcoidia bacterium]
MGSRWMRNSFVYLMILVAVIAIVVIFFRPGSTESPKKDLSQVINDARDQRVEKIEVSGNNLKVVLKDNGGEYTSRKEDNTSLVEILTSNDINPLPDVEVKQPSAFGNWFGLLLQFLPILIFIGLILFMMRQAQGSNSQAMSFGKSRARMFTANKPSVTFTDVAGVDEAKEELQEVVEFLKYPEKFSALGARIPRGVLLVGPPGTGKTLLSRAVAGEAGVPFFSIS